MGSKLKEGWSIDRHKLMGRTFVETIMGAVVLAVAGIFLAFALSQSDLGVVKGYTLSASFASVGGLSHRARMSASTASRSEP